jgi:hypothetical protein
MDMTSDPDNQGQRRTVQLAAPLSIRSVEAMHEVVKNALMDHVEVVVDIETDAVPDLSILQLIEAARLYAASVGKSFRLQNPASVSVRKTLARAGLVSKDDADFNRFWFHDEGSR